MKLGRFLTSRSGRSKRPAFSDGRFSTISKADLHKSEEVSAALEKLRSFLDAAEPGLVYFLVNTWNLQGQAITYKELREAILSGDISADYLEQWRQDYTSLVEDRIAPGWRSAMDAATDGLEKRFHSWSFDPYSEGVRSWTESRAAEFVTSSTATQIGGLRAVVQRAAVLEDMSVDQLARAIRPMVGLTKQQSVANLNYYSTLVNSGTGEKKALELSMRYAARQQRYRGYNIARTELAFAYNQGSYEGTRQAQAAGLMGDTVKVWCTADDERTCSICGALEGQRIAMDGDFDFSTRLAVSQNPTIRRVPPAHPSCRCVVLFEEVGPPMLGDEERTENFVDGDVKESLTGLGSHGIMDSRNMAMGLRHPASRILSDDEIESVKADAKALGIGETLLRFNTGGRTGFSDDLGTIGICGDILPDSDSKIARDCMSQRAVLAHEYYGHYLNNPSEYRPGDWRDEFRASYEAAIKAPNLTDDDRGYLMLDAYDRAREAGQILSYDETARRIIYGY